MMKMIYLVSCVSKKRPSSSTAKDLYQSEWFRKARRYVESTGMPWFILSAKYGLLSPDALISPYEQTLNTMPTKRRQEWAGMVVEQIKPHISKEHSIVVLAGSRYREFLMPALRSMVGKLGDMVLQRVRTGMKRKKRLD